MKLSDYAIMAVAVLAITVIAWGWRQEGIKRAVAERDAQVLAESIKVHTRAFDSAFVVYTSTQKAYNRDTLRLSTQLSQARATIASLRDQGDSLDTVLVRDTTSADSIKTLTRLAATRLQEARVCGVALDSTTVEIGRCRGLLRVSDSLLVEHRGLLAAQERLTEQYRRLSHPSIMDRVRRGVPWLAAGVVLGAIVAR